MESLGLVLCYGLGMMQKRKLSCGVIFWYGLEKGWLHNFAKDAKSLERGINKLIASQRSWQVQYSVVEKKRLPTLEGSIIKNK